MPQHGTPEDPHGIYQVPIAGAPGAFQRFADAVAREGQTGEYKPDYSSENPAIAKAEDWMTRISRALTGGSEGEMNLRGRAEYPGVPLGSAHHAASAEGAASRFGFVPTQLGGAVVEGLENMLGSNVTPAGRKDTLNDIIANVMGGAVGSLPGPLRGIARPHAAEFAAKAPERAEELKNFLYRLLSRGSRFEDRGAGIGPPRG